MVMSIMAFDEVISKLETSNQGINIILENLDEHFSEIRADPRLEGLVDDLENLFHAYLKAWKESNTEILGLVKEDLKS